jgi:hypothetical protein
VREGISLFKEQQLIKLQVTHYNKNFFLMTELFKKAIKLIGVPTLAEEGTFKLSPKIMY